MTLSSRMLYILVSLLRFDLFSFIHAEDLRMVTSRGTCPNDVNAEGECGPSKTIIITVRLTPNLDD